MLYFFPFIKDAPVLLGRQSMNVLNKQWIHVIDVVKHGFIYLFKSVINFLYIPGGMSIPLFNPKVHKTVFIHKAFGMVSCPKRAHSWKSQGARKSISVHRFLRLERGSRILGTLRYSSDICILLILPVVPPRTNWTKGLLSVDPLKGFLRYIVISPLSF